MAMFIFHCRVHSQELKALVVCDESYSLHHTNVLYIDYTWDFPEGNFPRDFPFVKSDATQHSLNPRPPGSGTGFELKESDSQHLEKVSQDMVCNLGQRLCSVFLLEFMQTCAEGRQ